MHILNTLAPVFLIILLGGILGHTRFISRSFVTGINKLTYWIGLPTLLFYKIANASYGLEAAAKSYAVVAGGMVGCIILGYLACWLLKLPANSTGAFIQGAFRGNLIYIGLPIVVYSLQGQPQDVVLRIEEMTILTLSLIVPTYNIISVIVILAGQHKLDRHVPVRIAKELGRNPLIIACVLGGLYAGLIGPLPMAITRTCEAIGKMALPLALMSIGATIVGAKGFPELRYASLASVIKTFAAPVIGWPIAIGLGLNGVELQAVLMLLACPTAISSFILAEQLRSDKMLSATIVVLTSLLSLASFSITLVLLNI